MTKSEKLLCAIVKIASNEFWNSGYQSRGNSSAHDPVFSTPASKTIDKPKGLEPEGGTNKPSSMNPPGEGAMHIPLWSYANKGIVAGKGKGSPYTTGISGENFRA